MLIINNTHKSQYKLLWVTGMTAIRLTPVVVLKSALGFRIVMVLMSVILEPLRKWPRHPESYKMRCTELKQG